MSIRKRSVVLRGSSWEIHAEGCLDGLGGGFCGRGFLFVFGILEGEGTYEFGPVSHITFMTHIHEVAEDGLSIRLPSAKETVAIGPSLPHQPEGREDTHSLIWVTRF